jgi:hypothetical protein
VFKTNRRNVSILVYIKTHLTFRDLKPDDGLAPEENVFMQCHLFQTKQTNIARIGFMTGKAPRDTFHELFKAYIETEMHHILAQLPQDARNKYIQEFIRDYNATTKAIFEIQLQESHPNWTHSPAKPTKPMHLPSHAHDKTCTSLWTC